MIVNIIVILIIICIIFVYYLMKKYNIKNLSKFLKIFYEPKIKGTLSPKITGYYNSIYTEAMFIPQSKNSPPKLKISMDYRQGEKWKIKRKDKYEIDISFMKKIEIEDPYFKENFIIRAKEENLITLILNDPRKREAIMKIFNRVKAIVLSAKRGKIILIIQDLTPSNLSEVEMEEILKNLIILII